MLHLAVYGVGEERERDFAHRRSRLVDVCRISWSGTHYFCSLGFNHETLVSGFLSASHTDCEVPAVIRQTGSTVWIVYAWGIGLGHGDCVGGQWGGMRTFDQSCSVNQVKESLRMPPVRLGLLTFSILIPPKITSLALNSPSGAYLVRHGHSAVPSNRQTEVRPSLFHLPLLLYRR